MTDPVVHARLTEVQKRLAQPTPAPLEGQQTLDLPQPHNEPPQPPTRPPRPARRPR